MQHFNEDDFIRTQFHPISYGSYQFNYSCTSTNKTSLKVNLNQQLAAKMVDEIRTKKDKSAYTLDD